jgi:hypothetical protein
MSDRTDGATLYIRGVPRTIVRESKALAARRGITLTALVIEALGRVVGADSAPRAAEPSGSLGGLEADMAWYRAHKQALEGRYSGQYLAIAEQRVVDHDPEFGALAQRALERFGSSPIFMPRASRVSAS